MAMDPVLMDGSMEPETTINDLAKLLKGRTGEITIKSKIKIPAKASHSMIFKIILSI